MMSAHVRRVPRRRLADAQSSGEGRGQVRALRLTTIAVTLGALATWAVAPAADAQLAPGVDALVSVSARTRAATLVSPELRTRAPHSLLLAFVVARSDRSGEQVRSITAAGLRWSPVVRGDGLVGATEVWQARTRNWWSGRVLATLAAAAYPASVTVVAYAGSSPYVEAHTDAEGRASTPKTRLRAIAGSLVWTLGLSTAQRPPAVARRASEGRRVLLQTFEPRQRTAEWLELAPAQSANFATPQGASPAGSWRLVAVDVVVPSLEQLIEEGKITANGFIASVSTRPGYAPPGVSVPPDCPPYPEFEVGVEDDPVFLGLQPAMSPVRGFELAASVFHARLLRLNVIWGQIKLYGWAPYDQAVRMARERCWSVQLTIMPTTLYEEGFLNNELSAKHFNIELFASFAKEIATRYAGQVTRFAIDNEPNGSSFIPPGELETKIAFYDSLYLASAAAVRSADPGAQVLAGELGGKNISEWLPNVAQLPSDGVGIHPYGSLVGDIGELVREVAPVPLLVTEYGVAASHPDQIAKDLESEETARREGARAFIFYQLSRADTGEGKWDTGIE
jgi:hypothetical protein